MLCCIVHFHLPNKEMPGLELLVVVISQKKGLAPVLTKPHLKIQGLKNNSLFATTREDRAGPAGWRVHCWLHELHLEIYHVRPLNQHSGVVALGDRPRLYLQLGNLADLVASWHTFYLHSQNNPYCGLGLQNLDHRGDYICGRGDYIRSIDWIWV